VTQGLKEDGPAKGITWVDPRGNPAPPTSTVPLRVTEDPDEITELVEFCRIGRIYAVERWIKVGRPIQAKYQDVGPWHHTETPLVVAIETNQYDLARLLLCNGYRPELEPQSVLDLTLRERSWDYLELVLAWGAEPKKVDPWAILDTYQRSLMDRFWNFGVDFTSDHCLASYLSSSTRNKPAYGFARRHQDDPRVAYDLALALGDAVLDNREKAVSLLLWSGADPHRKVPSLKYGSGFEGDPDDDLDSAIEVAVQMGHGQLLRHLRPDPSVDDFDEMFAWVHDPDALDYLTAHRAPKDWSKTIVRNASRLSWAWGDRWRSRECLKRILTDHEGRLGVLSHHECQDFRRTLLKWESGDDLRWFLRLLSKPKHCDPDIFAEMIRTPAIRAKMTDVGLLKATPRKQKRRGKRRR